MYRPDIALPAREALKTSLHIPCSGTRQALTYRPSRMPTTSPPEAVVTGLEVVVSVITDPSIAAQVVEKQLLELEQNLHQWAAGVNADIATLEHQIRTLMRDLLARRLGMLRQRDAMAAAFSIPVRRVEPQRALEIPVRRTTIALKTSPAPAAGGRPEWYLSDAVYEQVVKTITSFTQALERRPSSATSLLPDEETLRDWLIFMLSTNYEAPDGKELFVGGETVNGKGKTDILIRHQDLNPFIGECKFWDGPKKFDDAIGQLLDYTVWRDTKAAIILFITRRNATAAIDSAGARLAGHSQCRQAKVPADPARRRDYVFASPHDSQRTISLALLPVVVPRTAKAGALAQPVCSEID